MAKGTVNKVVLLGRLGADPEVRYMPSGMAVANLRLATNDGYKDKNSGEFVESTEWHRVVLFGRLAEIANEYLKKGSLAYVEGRIRTNKWQDQSGQDRYTVEVVANEMQLIGGSGGAAGGSNQFAASAPQETKAPAAKKEAPVAAAVEEDDEIPF